MSILTGNRQEYVSCRHSNNARKMEEPHSRNWQHAKSRKDCPGTNVGIAALQRASIPENGLPTRLIWWGCAGHGREVEYKEEAGSQRAFGQKQTLKLQQSGLPQTRCHSRQEAFLRGHHARRLCGRGPSSRVGRRRSGGRSCAFPQVLGAPQAHRASQASRTPHSRLGSSELRSAKYAGLSPDSALVAKDVASARRRSRRAVERRGGGRDGMGEYVRKSKFEMGGVSNMVPRSRELQKMQNKMVAGSSCERSF
jgi:hypothetical protein